MNKDINVNVFETEQELIESPDAVEKELWKYAMYGLPKLLTEYYKASKSWGVYHAAFSESEVSDADLDYLMLQTIMSGEENKMTELELRIYVYLKKMTYRERLTLFSLEADPTKAM